MIKLLLIPLLMLFIPGIAQQLPFTGKDTSFRHVPFSEKQAFARRLSSMEKKATVASGNFNIHHYRCEWESDPAVRYITGKVTCSFTILSTAASVVLDLGGNMRVDSVTWHNRQLGFGRLPGDGLEIRFSSPLPANQKDSFTVFYQGVPAGGGSTAFYNSQHNGVPVMWTLSEPYGAKEWWPCKDGLTDKADSIDIFITCPEIYTASSIGERVSETILNGKKTSHWKHRYPVASYLVAMAITDYMVLNDSITIGSRVLPLVDYAYPEFAPDFRSNVQYTRYALQLYSRLFGDYPFIKEKYGHTQFGWPGGMEHQTNSFVNYPSLPLIAHESAHQWFGDMVTCGSWQDLWLNEGFATYLQLLYNESLGDIYLREALENFGAEITALPGGSVWVKDTLNTDRLFSIRLTYYKGSYLLHMLRWVTGDSAFFRGVRSYLHDPAIAYSFARTTDLQRHLELESGKDLSVFFSQWLYGEGYPSYTVEWTQDSTNLVHVKLSQTTSHPSVPFYRMPVPVQFGNSQRDTIMIFTHGENRQSFLFNPGFRIETAMFDPHLRILSARNNITQRACPEVNAGELFPRYAVSWTQNNNNWLNFSIRQTNPQAAAETRGLPVYIHFEGSGRDSAIRVNGNAQTLLQLGFKVERVYFTSPSCFMANRFTIEQQHRNEQPNMIRVFPVPVSDRLYISVGNLTDNRLNIRLFDSAGKLVYRKEVITEGRDELLEVPFTGLPAGTYLLKVQGERSVNHVQKVLR